MFLVIRDGVILGVFRHEGDASDSIECTATLKGLLPIQTRSIEPSCYVYVDIKDGTVYDFQIAWIHNLPDFSTFAIHYSAFNNLF
jgi:hypothetical protein